MRRGRGARRAPPRRRGRHVAGGGPRPCGDRGSRCVGGPHGRVTASPCAPPGAVPGAGSGAERPRVLPWGLGGAERCVAGVGAGLGARRRLRSLPEAQLVAAPPKLLLCRRLYRVGSVPFFFKVIFVQKEQKGGGALEGELPTLPAEDRTPPGAALFLCTCAWPYPLPAFGAVWDSHLYFHSRY